MKTHNGMAMLALLAGIVTARGVPLNGDFSDGLSGWETKGTTKEDKGRASLEVSAAAKKFDELVTEGLIALYPSNIRDASHPKHSKGKNGSTLRQTISITEPGVLTFDWNLLWGGDGNVYAMVAFQQAEYYTSFHIGEAGVKATEPGEGGVGWQSGILGGSIFLPYAGDWIVEVSALSHGETPGTGSLSVDNFLWTPGKDPNANASVPDHGGTALLAALGMATLTLLRR